MKNYHYKMCGLDYVHLYNGYNIHDTAYGRGVSIERADELDRTIALYVLVSHARLRGQEIRFLRSLTHLSQAEIATLLGIKRITVARWEGAPDTPIPGPADRAFRTLVAKHLFEDEMIGMVVERYSEITDERPEPLIMTLGPIKEDERQTSLFPEVERGNDGWKVKAA